MIKRNANLGLVLGFKPKKTQHSFPYSVTGRFDPPFKEVPAFIYRTTLLLTTNFTHYNTFIDTLTNEMFFLSILNTWDKLDS